KAPNGVREARALPRTRAAKHNLRSNRRPTSSGERRLMQKCLGCPKLRKDAIGQRVVVERDVLAKLEPATFFFVRLRDAVLFVLRALLPGIISNHRQVIPGAAFQMGHQNSAGGSVDVAIRGFAQHFSKIFTMTGSS